MLRIIAGRVRILEKEKKDKNIIDKETYAYNHTSDDFWARKEKDQKDRSW